MIWKGVPLGFTRDGKPIDYDGNAPVLVFGPPGSSKTVGVIATQLLDDNIGRRSYLVLDPKGEVCAITSKFRRSLRNHDVKIVNPYGVLVDKRPDMKSDGWVPLGDLDPDVITFGDDCQAKGDALIKTGSHESQPHFPDSARSGITAAIMWEVKEARAQNLPPSLANVRAILTQPPDKLRSFIQKMVDCGDFDISSRAAKFLADNTEIQNIKSTIETNTAWMTKPMRDDMCMTGGLDFPSFATRPTTAYFIIPPSELRAKAPYFRLALSSALRALYRDDGVPATLVVEEGYVLGYHAEIEQAASILRGYGSRFLIAFQSLAQAQELYPKTWGLFTGGAVLGYRPADLESAKWLTARAGTVVVPVLSASDPSDPTEVAPRPSWRQETRDRIPLGKMFGMPQGRALVWLPHDEAPRISHVKGYFDLRKLNARASLNPYYKSGSARPGRKILKIAGLALVAALLIAAAAHPPSPRLEISSSSSSSASSSSSGEPRKPAKLGQAHNASRLHRAPARSHGDGSP